MKYLGKVTSISHRGDILVKAGMTPQIGALVVDEKKGPIGHVVQLIGPVNSPYVVIRPNKGLMKRQLAMIEKKLFVLQGGRSRKDS